jgi:hypothetical protein
MQYFNNNVVNTTSETKLRNNISAISLGNLSLRKNFETYRLIPEPPKPGKIHLIQPTQSQKKETGPDEEREEENRRR